MRPPKVKHFKTPYPHHEPNIRTPTLVREIPYKAEVWAASRRDRGPVPLDLSPRLARAPVVLSDNGNRRSRQWGPVVARRLPGIFTFGLGITSPEGLAGRVVHGGVARPSRKEGRRRSYASRGSVRALGAARGEGRRARADAKQTRRDLRR